MTTNKIRIKIIYNFQKFYNNLRIINNIKTITFQYYLKMILILLFFKMNNNHFKLIQLFKEIEFHKNQNKERVSKII